MIEGVIFSSLNFWLGYVYFLCAIFTAFYIPGSVVLGKIKLTIFQQTVLSIMTGMVLWGWQGFIFGYMNFRFFSYIYIFVFFFIWIKHVKIKNPNFKKFLPDKANLILIVIIVCGCLMQLSSIWFTGVRTSQGLYFCCADARDNILNIAISQQVVDHFPPFEPGLYGKNVTNYHYWSSLITGELVRVYKLPLIATNYQYMTLFISIFLGLSAITFAKTVINRKLFPVLLVSFLYFGGDLIWLLVGLIHGSQIFTMQPIESGQKFLENLPRSFSIVSFFAFISLFVLWIKKKDPKQSVIISLIAASLVGFKIYTGLFVLSGLAFLGLYYLWKRDYKGIFPVVLSIVLSLIIYLPVNSGAGGFYFTGFWRFENFIVQPALGELNRLELARLIYLSHENWLRVAGYEILYLSLFFLLTFGVKIFGFVQNRKSLSTFPLELHLIFIPGFIASFILGSFFIQTSGGSNTFNFLVTIYILGSIYVALAFYYWLRNQKLLSTVVLCLILTVSLPRGVYATWTNIQNIQNHRGFTIDNMELMAIDRLSSIKTDSVVLVDPAFLMDYQTPYVGLLSRQRMFLSGQVDELEGHSINFSDRRRALNNILHSPNVATVSSLILRYNIGYLFMKGKDRISATDSAKFLEEVYENSSAKILKVNKDKISVSSPKL